MDKTQCAVCRTDNFDREIYPANFNAQDLCPDVFSARRLPDKIHYRIVSCRQCGLLRSNPVLDDATLAKLYEQSRFTYPQESQWAAQTYMRYFNRYFPGLSKDAHVLEVGCGNGTFINAMYAQGYTHIFGVEPSHEAIANAGAVRGFIHQGMFEAGIYPSEHFDVIVAFQVFDHLSHPEQFLELCRVYLKPQGKLFLIMHDIGALPARILGRACPMIDIEHPFLYNRFTLNTLLKAGGFGVQDQCTVNNCYPLKYWARLAPAPAGFKRSILEFLDRHPMGAAPVTLNAGNMGVVAVKN